MTSTSKTSSAIVKIVFLALVLDLLAFTLPLPLFPRLIDYYLSRESNDPTTFLSQSLTFFRYCRAYLTTRAEWSGSASGREGTGITGANKRWDVVLLGGAMGSLFSFCQCLISPYLGRLSDRYGRKRVLLVTMIGNLLSALVWLQSTSFASYLLSRLIGGLSEGNVQLSQAIISDVTTESTRSKSLALVGIAFSICFTFGPSLGAYFASRSLPAVVDSSPSEGKSKFELNVYAFPAAISLVLLAVETLYIAMRLPETKGFKKQVAEKGEKESKNAIIKVESVKTRKERLKTLGRVHGLFLLFFSGAEFTLTFLTYDLFFATNRSNGLLLSYIGILSSILQGGYVRPALSKKKISELTFTYRGIISCSLGLFGMALLPLPAIRDSPYGSKAMLLAIATCLSYTSSTAVTGLMAAAAGCCDEDDTIVSENGEEKIPRGRALGNFRSAGQLGRALGPLLATAVYWVRGPTVTYAGLGVALLVLSGTMGGLLKEEKERRRAKKSQ